MLKVKQNNLILITSFIWIMASFILLKRAYSWLDIMTIQQISIGTIIALPLAFIKTKFIFIKLTQKNIRRIQSFFPKVSLWEFHMNKDKILIIVMIVGGITLRHLPFIPKYSIYPLYLGIGIAMFYVFTLYLRAFIIGRQKED